MSPIPENHATAADFAGAPCCTPVCCAPACCGDADAALVEALPADAAGGAPQCCGEAPA